MFKKAIQTLLLMSLFLNITHAAVISLIDRCDHQTLQEYIMEIDQGSDCGDLCDAHYIFHLNAIATTPIVIIPKFSYSVIIDYYQKEYIPPFLEPSYRPPIV
ncbi:hypothetical protein [Hydrogenimonas thermophila]|uniref:Uncharacterized protein n=1 Tax=Hydrogenimonas thermophila TaxID=223786 RepID=A0A1I5QP82_9BACT|nr:hypothetical protein [Hydrogenimonas thermophila]SFP48032.1 hypothetical protein SAMN05216234_12127 [Hydrogenimonas thermophila]